MQRSVRVAAAVIGVAITLISAQTPLFGDEKSSVQEIRKELLQLPYYGVFDFLAFSYEKGTVSLMGYAYHSTLKHDAVRAAKRASGVDQVLDNIEELPVSQFDDDLRFPGMEPLGDYPLHIIVKNGHITLLGVVDTEGDKTVAGLRAREVPGSFSVENELVVERVGRGSTD